MTRSRTRTSNKRTDSERLHINRLGERGRLLTEQRLAASRRLDRLPIARAFDVLHREDARIAAAVGAARPAIVRAAARVAEVWRGGGRLFYVGAGTSGRLGVLDAAECPPTFRSSPEMVQGIIAGGEKALRRAVEGAEDDESAGVAAMRERRVGPRDAVFGIATGGTTPFVRAALLEARRRGATTLFLACVPASQAPAEVDVDIRVLTGPEALTGSTRMKAGLATKMVLNAVSTLGMVQLGKVYENLMVDLNSYACRKLTDRATRTVAILTELTFAEAGELLRAARGQVKVALVMHRGRLSRPAAQDVLSAAGGHVRRALDLISARRTRGGAVAGRGRKRRQ